MASSDGRSNPAAAMMAQMPPEVMQVLLRSDPAYIEATLGDIDAEYGSVQGYLTKELGVSPAEIAELRRRYTE